MARNRTTHPGVSIIQRTPGGTYFLKFRDPRQGQRQTFASTEDNSFELAEKIAEQLSEAIRTPDQWGQLPEKCHPRTREIWGISVAFDEVAKAERKLRASETTRWSKETKPVWKGREEREKREAELLAGRSPASDLDRAFLDYVAAKKDYVDKKDSKEKEFNALKQELSVAKKRIVELEGILRKQKVKVLVEQKPITVKEAIPKFFTEGGTTTDSHYIDAMRQWLNALASFAKEKNVWDITPKDLLVHLQDYKAKGNVGQRGNVCMQLIGWVTHGQFDRKPVADWLKGIRKNKSKPDPYWAEKAEVLALIKYLEETHGSYWADAAMLQWAGGFRPEEMPMLMRDNVRLGKEPAIYVAPIFHDGAMVRGLKTKRSQDWVRIPEFALDALKRRATGEGPLLFPRNKDSKETARWNRRQSYSDFEKQNLLWPDKDKQKSATTFSKAYKPKLQEAVKAAGGDPGKWDSRTLRRTCGKDLLKAGLNLTQVAAVLRDREETVREHYARLLGSDVSTER